VVLNLHPGRTLDRAQVAGIVKLVSGSVPELSPKAVSVVDSTGALLSAAGDDETQLGLDSQQLQYRRELEATHHKRILALLEPVVGGDNVRATVTADVDFSQVMQTAEAYAPNQGSDAKVAVREQRSEESNQPQGGAGGVPGAVANQPPVPAQAPINGAAQQLGPQQAGGAGWACRTAPRPCICWPAWACGFTDQHPPSESTTGTSRQGQACRSPPPGRRHPGPASGSPGPSRRLAARTESSGSPACRLA
jgi:flagellar M-ring protein FliF